MYLNKQNDWTVSIRFRATLNSGYGNYCRVLKQTFYHPISADSHLVLKLISFCSFSFLGLHLCLHLSEASRCFRRQRRSECIVRGLRPQGPISIGHIYRKLVSVPWYSGYVNLSVCFYSLYVTKHLVPFLLFTFSHSQPPPLCITLFVPAELIDCLFISGPASASAPVDEIVMVSVIFCGGTMRVKAIRRR